MFDFSWRILIGLSFDSVLKLSPDVSESTHRHHSLEIIIFPRASQPPVLREYEDRYRILSQAYVRGIMDGEAFSDPDFVIETIKIYLRFQLELTTSIPIVPMALERMKLLGPVLLGLPSPVI